MLLTHALAERHNQAGLHRGIGLPDLLDAIPFEPTVPFGKVPGGGKDTTDRQNKGLEQQRNGQWC